MEIKIKYQPHYDAEWGAVTYAKAGDAGFDLRAALDEPLILVPGNVYVIPTGVSFALPDGFEMQIRSRSGMASKGVVVANAPGTVDAGYRGEVKILLHAVAGLVRLKPGDRIAQAVVSRVEQARFIEVNELDMTERGVAGFGSTGVM
jgi:dUTP pyrophosphatase